jgi:hypothetical protein
MAVAELTRVGAGERSIAKAVGTSTHAVVDDRRANGQSGTRGTTLSLPDTMEYQRSDTSSTTPTITLRSHEGQVVEYPEPRSVPTFNQTKGDGISWAKWSWNPVTGCRACSRPGRASRVRDRKLRQYCRSFLAAEPVSLPAAKLRARAGPPPKAERNGSTTTIVRSSRRAAGHLGRGERVHLAGNGRELFTTRRVRYG